MNGKAETPEGLAVFGGKTGTTKAAGYCLIMGTRTEDGLSLIHISIPDLPGPGP